MTHYIAERKLRAVAMKRSREIVAACGAKNTDAAIIEVTTMPSLANCPTCCAILRAAKER